MSDLPAETGFATDFSWIQGRLRREEFEGGFWSLEFGSAEDPHGGTVVLGNPPELGDAEDGALMRVEGRLDPDRMTFFMAGTFYELVNATTVRG